MPGKRWLILIALVLGLILAWILTTDHPAVWPIRNTVEYHILTTWWEWAGQPQVGDPGLLRGTVRDARGRPITGAWVLVSRWDGTTYTGRTDETGQYLIDDIPAGSYRPIAGATGYEDVLLGSFWKKVGIRPGEETRVDVVLPDQKLAAVSPGGDLTLGEPTTLTCSRPFDTTANRRQVTFDNAGEPNQLTLYYTPITATATSQLPILLAIYPGPADTWECASLPLTTAGYAVVGTGPAYTFELEKAIDEQERLLEFARTGRFPGSDPTRIAILGGSYSALHVQRLIQRNQDYQAALLLGPPTDLFDMRRRLEQGSYIPPFGLDQALIALGLPDREPQLYWRYSGAYHVRSDFPPLAILHSRSDEVVPYQQSRLLATNLDQVGAAYEIHFFDGASHYLLAEEGDADAIKIYEITQDFLARHLR